MCAAAPTITGTTGLNYAWTGLTAPSTNIIIAPSQTTEQLVLSRKAGNYSYSVTANDGVLCPATQTVSVTIEAPLNPSINPFDPCLDPTTLSASPIYGRLHIPLVQKWND